MSRRDRHGWRDRSGEGTSRGGPQEWRGRIESLLAAGKTREAVDAAKQWFKETRSLEAEALLAEAYEARLHALMARGLHEEARELATRLRERFVPYRDRFAEAVRWNEMLSGKLETLLAELTSATPPRRREIEAALTRKLTDPGVLADSTILPLDDPLRQGARLVVDLFGAVTSGPLPDGALARLDGIPRQSPLAPWKLLTRALDAFYRRADAVVLANLSAIPADSGPRRLVPVLRRLVGEAAHLDDRSSAVVTLLDRVTAGRARLRSALKELTQALGAKSERAALSAAQSVLSLLESAPVSVRRIFVASLLHHWLRLDLNPDPLMRGLRRTADPEVPRLAAVALERIGAWDAALAMWDQYLTGAIGTGTLPATGLEPSLILLHMAQLFPADPHEVWDAFGVQSEEELRRLIRAGELPACFDPGQLLERALAAHPESGVFRALVAHYDGREPKRAETEAERWRRAHPQELEPLLYMIRAAERRGGIRRALALLVEAEALNRVHPEVRQSRFRLLLASAERRIKEGKLALASADLDLIEREPRAGEGDYAAYLTALRWAIARKAGNAEAAGGWERALAGRTGNPVLDELILDSVSNALDVEPPSPCPTPSLSEIIDAVVRALDLFRVLERPLTARPDRFTEVEGSVSRASVAQLHSLCLGGLGLGRPSLTYVASGQGLAADGPHLYRFLLARGRVLGAASGWQDRERARQCLRAARALAGRARDQEAIREASAALDTLTAEDAFDPFGLKDDVRAEPTPEAIASIIVAERRHRHLPRFKAPMAPRKRPRRRRRRQGALLDDLLALIGGKL